MMQFKDLGRRAILGIAVFVACRLHLGSSFSVPYATSRTLRFQPPAIRIQSQSLLQAEKKPKAAKGVYIRPSSAIERGSGFFVPGLEGPRVRFVFVGILLMLTAINHQLMGGTNLALSLEEGLAVGYSLLVLFQATVEYFKEDSLVLPKEGGRREGNGNDTKGELRQQWRFTSQSGTSKSRVQWAAASYISLTPATHMMLVQSNELSYRLGTTIPTINSEGDQLQKGAEAALTALSKSSSGRIALPASHPACEALLPWQHRRCVVLQRITPDSCWIMASDQLLASFSKQDLVWLGQLAAYVR